LSALKRRFHYNPKEVFDKMRLTLSASLIFALLFSVTALAQDTPKVQVFGGYSLLHADTAGLSNSAADSFLGTTGSSVNSNFNGWNAELQYNLKSWLGAVADVSGNYGTALSVASSSGLPSAPGFNSYSFLFGPSVQHSMGRLRPFAHALFGANRLSSDTTAATNLFGTPPTTPTDTAFAMALGGGVDYKLSKGFGLRLGQIDYLYTKHDSLAYSGSFFGTDQLAGVNDHQNNLRFSAGLVFGF
jgi:opacity protein-like surface antigen